MVQAITTKAAKRGTPGVSLVGNACTAHSTHAFRHECELVLRRHLYSDASCFICCFRTWYGHTRFSPSSCPDLRSWIGPVSFSV